MKHRERVIAALNHQETDHSPMEISFTPEFAARLRADLQLRGAGLHNPHGGGNTYELERALDMDMLLTSVGWANSYYQAGYREGETYTDEWGVTWRGVGYDTPFGRGIYTEIAQHPLADEAALVRYVPPDPTRPSLYTDTARTIHDFKDEYWIVGVTVTTIWETAVALRGYANLLTDLVANPELVARILDIPLHYHLTAAQELTRLGIDMLWIGDDVGGQNSMIMSPAHWRKFLKPRLAQFIAGVKAINPQLKVAYHSDGSVYPIIPELIEVGVDILNPIQPACMDPALLKRQYGDRLCFWGTLDEQYNLPFGTPASVRAEVQERLRTVGRGGGLIIGPTHNVQLDTPLENFWAMMEAITGRVQS
jgi:uroporphyrinogen decarboxylase